MLDNALENCNEMTESLEVCTVCTGC